MYLSPSFVSDVILQYPLVKGNTACEKFISDAINEPSDASLSMRACLKTHDVIVACGEKETLCFLPTEGKWYQLADKLSTHDSYHYGISSLQNKLFVVGACMERDGHIAECYDPTCNQWTPITAPELVDHGITAVALGGLLYIVGGRDRNKVALSAVQKYDPDTNRWREVAPLRSPRSSICAVTDGRYIYAIGGISPDFQYLNVVERYDPMNDTWTELPSTLRERAFASGTAIKQNIFLFGGLLVGHLLNGTGDPCEVYNSDTNIWIALSSVVAPRSYVSAVNFEGQIYVNGVVRNEGFNEQDGPFRGMKNVLQMYDAEKNEWKSCPESVLRYNWHELTTLTIPNNVLVKCKEISKDNIQRRQTPRSRQRLQGARAVLPINLL